MGKIEDHQRNRSAKLYYNLSSGYCQKAMATKILHGLLIIFVSNSQESILWNLVKIGSVVYNVGGKVV